jgi:hypothetical protein
LKRPKSAIRFKFLGKYIRWVSCARDVRDENFLHKLSLPNRIFTNVEVTHAFGAERVGPFHSTTVVIIERCRLMLS